MSACPSCGRAIADGFAFCPHCGAALAPAAAATEERKLVTVLFADVTGSTQLAETLDAEVVREVMAGYFAIAREEIEARGGTVEKFIGDAVMAVFGVPVAHEDDPARALRAALAIRDRLAELSERGDVEGLPALRVRIGVNSGEVVSTAAPRPGEVMVTGDAVNVAARIQQMAEPGQILVGARAALAAPNFRFSTVGATVLRGKAASVDVSQLDGEEAGGGSWAVLRAPLVGREEELALLRSVYERVAAERRPHLVTLYGQPGVGKSRLTYELVRGLEAHPSAPLVTRGRCLSYGSGVTFWPLAEILKSQADILDSESPETARAKLESLGDHHFGRGLVSDPRRTTALLGYTVGIAIPGHDFSHLDPEVLRVEIVDAWRSFFSALAVDRPLVAVIEDIHWADAALLDVLDDLGERVQGPVLFVCPARPDLNDRRPSWGGGRRSFSAIYIDPLGVEQTSRLIGLLLEVEDLPPDLHERIVERAGGNPFFAEEILRHLIDRGHIRRDGEGWRAVSGPTTVTIPDTVQAVLAARIDLLDPDEKRALQAAAVVGRTFWPSPIARYLEASTARTAQLVRGLEARDFVIARLGSTMAGQPEFIFKHALVRDVAYESIPKRDRSLAHLQVARWIEETVGDRRLEVVELLAHHYTEAQRAASWGKVEPDRREEIRSRAVDLLFEAAEEAGKLYAMDRAKARVVTGLELARGPVERARGLEAHARMALWEDDGDEAWHAAREAIDLRMSAPGEVDRRAVARLCGFLLAIPTRWPGLVRELPTRHEAQPYLDLGLSMLDGGDSEERLGLLMAKASWGWGFGETVTDPSLTADYMAAGDEAVALARRLGHPGLLSGALDTVGASRQEEGGYGAALPSQEERLRLIAELDDPAEIADILGTNAWALVHIGHYRRAAELRVEDFTTRAQAPFPLQAHRTKAVFNAVARFRLGEWDRFWDLYDDLDAVSDHRRPMPYHLMRLYGVAAYLHEVAGHGEQADQLVAELDRWQASRGAVGVSGPRLWIVEILVRRRQFAEARRRLLIVDPVRGTQNRDYDLEAWGELIASEGAWDEAMPVVNAARDWAQRSGLLALPAFADRLEGRAMLAAGELDGGIDRLERARTTYERLEAAWDRARIELLIGEAHLSAGREVAAAALGASALATVERLPAPSETARARTLRAGG